MEAARPKNLLSGLGMAIDKGIGFLSEHQFHHGEFCTYIGEGTYLEKWCIPDSTTFSTAAICTSLLPLSDDPDVGKIFQKAAGFLKYHMMRGGAWNYFTTWHKLFPLCPADIDCTAVISYFLEKTGHAFPDNRALILANRNTRGLFYTWFTFRLRDAIHLRKAATHWKLLARECMHPLGSLLFWLKSTCSKSDVDAVVNANVALYLGDDARTAPAIRHLIRVIREGRETVSDKWYRNPLEVYYAISRVYAGGAHALEAIRELITARILDMARPDGCIGDSAADTAMAMIALMHLGYQGSELKNGVRYLISCQTPSGSWQRQALCFSGASIVWGSEELSTALCLEALGRYRLMDHEHRVLSTTKHHIHEGEVA